MAVKKWSTHYTFLSSPDEGQYSLIGVALRKGILHSECNKTVSGEIWIQTLPEDINEWKWKILVEYIDLEIENVQLFTMLLPQFKLVTKSIWFQLMLQAFEKVEDGWKDKHQLHSKHTDGLSRLENLK